MASHIFLGHREALWTAEPVGCHHATGSGDGKGYFRILARDPPQDSSNARPDGCPQQSRPERAHRVEAAACNIHAEGSQYQTRRSSDRNGQPDRQAQLCRSLKPARTQKNARNRKERNCGWTLAVSPPNSAVPLEKMVNGPQPSSALPNRAHVLPLPGLPADDRPDGKAVVAHVVTPDAFGGKP